MALRLRTRRFSTSRFFAVAVPVSILKPFRIFSDGVSPVMTWGGLKGGISIALVLSLPDGEQTTLRVVALSQPDEMAEVTGVWRFTLRSGEASPA